MGKPIDPGSKIRRVRCQVCQVPSRGVLLCENHALSRVPACPKCRQQHHLIPVNFSRLIGSIPGVGYDSQARRGVIGE